MKLENLPPIGQPFREEPVEVPIYAGLSLEKERPVALVLMSSEVELNWNNAQAWAKEKGGTLPSRIDALVLFQNLRKSFKEAAYWTDTPYADAESYAWGQDFDNGTQYYTHEDDTLRAVAVRRIPIEGER